jgi:hypothetical protein
MSRHKSPVVKVPNPKRGRGRPEKPAGTPRIETTVAMGCTLVERARLKAGALEVEGRSLSNYLREMAGLDEIK